MYIRDLHRFDERVASPTHDTPLKTTSLTYNTLPIGEGALWSTLQHKGGLFPVILLADGIASPMALEGPPVVKELNAADLSISQPLQNGGKLTVVFAEDRVFFTALDNKANLSNGRGISSGGQSRRLLFRP